MEFVIQNLPMLLCLIVGVALLAVEALMPGFGIPGVSGVVFLAVSIYFAWSKYGVRAGIGATLVVIALSALCVTLTLRSAGSGRLSRTALVLKGTSGREEGYQANRDLSAYVGRRGKTLTVLRPSGIVDIDGERLNVVSRGEFINEGVSVRVAGVEGARVIVEELA